MTRYAEGTKVSPERSQAEISELLRKYGAKSFISGYEGNRAMIAFTAHDRTIRFVLELPEAGADEFRYTPTRQKRTDVAARSAYEAEVRRRWRALALAIKAKLEAVETGIASFEDEFLAYTVLPDNSTVGERAAVELEEVWAAGQAPPRLLQLESGAGR